MLAIMDPLSPAHNYRAMVYCIIKVLNLVLLTSEKTTPQICNPKRFQNCNNKSLKISCCSLLFIFLFIRLRLKCVVSAHRTWIMKLNFANSCEDTQKVNNFTDPTGRKWPFLPNSSSSSTHSS